MAFYFIAQRTLSLFFLLNSLSFPLFHSLSIFLLVSSLIPFPFPFLLFLFFPFISFHCISFHCTSFRSLPFSLPFYPIPLYFLLFIESFFFLFPPFFLLYFLFILFFSYPPSLLSLSFSLLSFPLLYFLLYYHTFIFFPIQSTKLQTVSAPPAILPRRSLDNLHYPFRHR